MTKEKRPSPSESATLFKTGTIKLGNDNNKWIIVENAAGVKRWRKVVKNETSSTVDKNGLLIKFKLPGPKSLKGVGILDIELVVVIGEYNYIPDNGFTKFKKGKYYIYKLDDNLILSKKEFNKKDFANIEWNYTGSSVDVDGGKFGFWDLKYLKALYVFNLKKYKKKSLAEKIPQFTNILDNSNYPETLFIKIKNW